VYTDYKRGGNLHLTIVRKVDGDLVALRDELRGVLGQQVGMDPDRVVVNGLARQVVVKGLVKGVVERYLRERRF
jgi:large subunit ribosomal protein L49